MNPFSLISLFFLFMKNVVTSYCAVDLVNNMQKTHMCRVSPFRLSQFQPNITKEDRPLRPMKETEKGSADAGHDFDFLFLIYQNQIN